MVQNGRKKMRGVSVADADGFDMSVRANANTGDMNGQSV
jgi:hypothetical protein